MLVSNAKNSKENREGAFQCIACQNVSSLCLWCIIVYVSYQSVGDGQKRRSFTTRIVSWRIRSRVYTLQPYNVMTNNAVETAEGDGGVDMEDMGFKM